MRTRTQLRQLIAKEFPPLPQISATSDSGASTTTLKDVSILAGQEDNHFIGAHIYTTASGEQVRVTDSVQSTGVLTFIPAMASAPNAVAYEILPYSADAIHDALDEAIEHAYDLGWLGRRVEAIHFVTGSPIYNSTFDYWLAAAASTAVDGWTVTGGTASHGTRAESHVMPGQQIATILGSATSMDLNLAYRPYLSELRGHSITLYLMCSATVASEIRGQLMVDGSAAISTSYHSGDDRWELLSASADISSDGIEIYPRIQLAANTGTNRVGAIWVEGGPSVYEYPFPIGMLPDGPDDMQMSAMSIDTGNLTMDTRQYSRTQAPPAELIRYQEASGLGTSEYAMLRFNRPPPSRRVLYMPSLAPITKPTADAGYLEVDFRDSLILSKLAAMKLIEKDMYGTNTQVQSQMANIVARKGRELEQLTRNRGEGAETAVSLPIGW